MLGPETINGLDGMFSLKLKGVDQTIIVLYGFIDLMLTW